MNYLNWRERGSLGKVRRPKVAYYIVANNYFEIQAEYQQTVFAPVDYIPDFEVFVQ